MTASLRRGDKEEGTITTPFDRTMRNDLDRFHLVMDTIDRLPPTGEKDAALERRLKEQLEAPNASESAQVRAMNPGGRPLADSRRAPD